jgi:hypothetical protein
MTKPGVWGCVRTRITRGRIIGTHVSTKAIVLSGLTFQEWTPDVDTSRSPVSMTVNSSELRVTGFRFK